jgi:YegS/Rv2252/BmrU family lipid kinase
MQHISRTEPALKVEVIVNPVAGSGAGAAAFPVVKEAIGTMFPLWDCLYTHTTQATDAVERGRTSAADLLIVVGGDGTVHDTLQGLMARPVTERPALVMLPVGSGNDIARTLRMQKGLEESLKALPSLEFIDADVGECNGVYFLETLSFGVDAAVALNTYELRKANQSRGFKLYAQAALGTIARELKAHHFQMRIDGRDSQRDLLICAVQNGPTYGSGFKVAPTASIRDGKLNVAMADQVSIPVALAYLARMKGGHHLGLKHFSFCEAQSLHIELPEQIPIQCDGERLLGTSFDIGIQSSALCVGVGSAGAATRTSAAAGAPEATTTSA